ncbi:hypothetical protein AB6D11_25455 [Vibrio splendidus]
MHNISFKVRGVNYKDIHKPKKNHEEILLEKDKIVYAAIQLFPVREPNAFAGNVDIDVQQAALELDVSYKFEYKNRVYDARLEPLSTGGISPNFTQNYNNNFVALVDENHKIDNIILHDKNHRFFEFHMINFYPQHKKFVKPKVTRCVFEMQLHTKRFTNVGASTLLNQPVNATQFQNNTALPINSLHSSLST